METDAPAARPATRRPRMLPLAEFPCAEPDQLGELRHRPRWLLDIVGWMVDKGDGEATVPFDVLSKARR